MAAAPAVPAEQPATGGAAAVPQGGGAAPGAMRRPVLEQRILDEERGKVAATLAERGDGSMLRGWRREFDPSGNLEVHFADYCKVAVKLKLVANTELLFGGDDDNDLLALGELAPSEGELLNQLKQWIAAEFGSTRQLFRTLDAGNAGKLSREDLVKAGEKTSFPATAQEWDLVYEVCDYADVGFIQDDDIIFLELDPKVRARELFKVKVCSLDRWKSAAAQEYTYHMKKNKSIKAKGERPAKDRSAPRVWLDRTYEQLPAVASYKRHESEWTVYKHARDARLEFLAHLDSVYGNKLRAFRKVLAVEGEYCFTQKQLRKYCNRLNLHIDPWALWKGIDKDSDGTVYLEELCPEYCVALAGFKLWAAADPALGPCANIWKSPEAAAAAREKSGTWFSDKKMQLGVFYEALKKLEWPQLLDKPVRKMVFDALDYHGCGVITKADLEWLDRWRAPEWAYVKPDHAAWEELKALLAKKHGHPLVAWRKELDRDDSNVVNWQEFKSACLRLGYPRYAGAWRALDTDASQSISMVEYDPESAELLRSFKEWAEVQFGSVKSCFKALDADCSGNVTFAELKRACHKLNWEGDVKVLFASLDTDGARVGAETKRSISYAEIAFLDTWHVEPTDEELAAAETSVVNVTKLRKRSNTAHVASITDRLASPVEFTLSRYRTSEYLGKRPDWMEKTATERRLPSMDATQPGMLRSSSTGLLGASSTFGATAARADAEGGPRRARVRARLDRTFNEKVDALVEMTRTWG